MGCFSACFRKSRRSRKPTNPTPRTIEFLQSLVKEEENAKALINPNPDSIDEELGVSGRKKVTFDLKVQFQEKLPVTDENHGNEDEEEKEKESNCLSSSRIHVPNNYRYQNCRESDEDDEFDDELASEEDHDYMGDNEEESVSNDSLVSEESSLSSSIESLNEKLATDEIKSFESVSRPAGKENNMSSMKPNLTDKVTKSKNSCEEMVAVDTSLSSWLNTTPKSRDNRSYEDRPILGVLTVEEIRQFSVTSTPRRSPSPDDMPIIGSVGSYWRS